MYKDQATLLGADVIKFCSVMQVEKKLLIILPLVLACSVIDCLAAGLTSLPLWSA